MTSYESLARELQAARIRAGKTQHEAARILGCTAQAVSSWERGCTRIDCVSLFRLLEGYNADIYAFLTNCGVRLPAVSGSESECPRLSAAYHTLTPDNQEKLCRIAEILAETGQNGSDRPQSRVIPLYNYLAAAGYPSPSPGEDYQDYIVDAGSAADFAVRIDGDSMEPWIRNGDIVFAQRRVDLRDGDVGIFYARDGMVCKQYCQDFQGNIYLFSLNRQRRDADIKIPFSSDMPVFCYGKVIMPGHIPLPDD